VHMSRAVRRCATPSSGWRITWWPGRARRRRSPRRCGPALTGTPTPKNAMSLGYDVAARLAEGRGAVDTVQEYVSACGANADLAARDWYGSEDGMDLGALDADRAALAAAAAAAEDVLHVQSAQLRTLVGAWEGAGGDAAADFLRRHCETASVVVSALRIAAES